jgi:ribose 1,5-bisphosphokinase
VSEVVTNSGLRPAAIGPGRFVLVVGPSGAGKDTLLALAQAACGGADGVVFPRRVVTRQASPSEDNTHLDLEEFELARRRGDFAVHWQAHGHCYGLPRAINDEIHAGRTVVANVSRTMVEAIRRGYADVTVVLVTAPSEVLARRLAGRKRNSDGRIEDRLRRSIDDAAAAPDVTINNVGEIQDHADELVRIIRGE